jgi:fructokinase
MTQTLFAGIEGGGTKFVCAVADENNQILAETRIPTTSPDQTRSLLVRIFSSSKAALAPFDR